MSGQKKYWSGTAPDLCQICDQPITACFIDGKTQWDCWACMCPSCWEMHGEGLGTGKGQMYGRQEDGRWVKIESCETEFSVIVHDPIVGDGVEVWKKLGESQL